MRLGTPAWRATLRIARRDAVRRGNRARTALIAAMIGLPVAVVTGVVVLNSTTSLSEEERLPDELGLAVARITPSGRGPIVQDPFASNVQPADLDGDGSADADPEDDGAAAASWTAAEIERLTGGRLLPERSGSSTITVDAGTASVDLVETDLRDPVVSASLHLARGRLPVSPDEVAIARTVAARGPDVDDTVRLGDAGTAKRVSGVFDSYTRYGVVGLPGSLAPALGPGAEAGAGDTGTRPTYLLDRDAPVTWSEVRRWNRSGLAVLSRAVVEDPPSRGEQYPELSSGEVDTALLSVLMILVTGVVLEVVLLAGPSFAVGVRRQRRQLALVAASGGSPRQVARVVRAQALVIGIGSALAGAALGVAGVAAVTLWRSHDDPTAFGPFEVVWWQVAALVALGAGAAVVAAWVPSRQAARADVVLELTGRRGPGRRRPGHPFVGAALLAGGLLMTRSAMRPGQESMAAWATILLVLAGLALLPLLVSGVARFGPRLPLPLRLATRDADRHRSRTTPAVAAVMGSVAAVTALAIGGFSDQEEARAEYQPRVAEGRSLVEGAALARDDVWARTRDRVAELAPASTLEPVGRLTLPASAPRDVAEVYLPTDGCPDLPPTDTETDSCRYDWSNPQPGPGTPEGGIWSSGSMSDSLVAEPAELATLGWALDDAQRATLAAGGVLVPRADSIRPDGTTTLTVTTSTSGTERPEDRPARSVRVEAALAPVQTSGGAVMGTGVVLTPGTATRLGFGWYRDRALLTGGAALSPGASETLDEAVRAVNSDLTAYTERGPDDSDAVLIFLVLAGAGTLLVLIGTFAGTGLALADARADLATLAAVGAPPRTRRSIAASQSLVIALLGTLTGAAIGFAPGLAVTRSLTTNGSSGPYLDIPWLLLGLIVVVVPLLAAAVTAAVTRSQLPVVRRLAQ